MKTFSIYLSLILLIGSCHKPKNDESSTIAVDFTGSADTLISVRQLMTDVEYIMLENTDTFFVAAAQKILELDDKLFILDRHKHVIVAYDLQGNLIGQVGNKGKGPGEFLELKDFDINPEKNSLTLFSRVDMSVLEFKSDLSFVREVHLDMWGSQMSILESGNIALYSWLNDDGIDSYNISIFDYEGNKIASKMPIPSSINGYVAMNYSGFLSGNFYTYPLSSMIFRFDEDMENDQAIFEIEIPNKRPENLRFDHSSFWEGVDSRELDEAILGPFEIGGNNAKELICYYNIPSLGLHFVPGIRLTNGQTFGHLKLKQEKPFSEDNFDMFTRIFFSDVYNIPTYSKTSGYYYIATNMEYMYGLSTSIGQQRLEELAKKDNELYEVLSKSKGEIPIICRFRLRDEFLPQNIEFIEK